MDPASIIAVATFAQSLSGIGSDAPDPSRVAMFETYQAVLVLNERVDELGKLLVEVRKDQIDLPNLIDDGNRASEARVAERKIVSYMDAILGSHLQMLDNVAAGQDYNAAASRFNAELVRHNINFDTELGVLIRAAIYELPTALAAIEMAMAIDAADGSAPQAVKNRALASIADVEVRLATAIAPELERYGGRVDALKAELNGVIGEDWWTDGGRRVDRELSYYDLYSTLIYCWEINTIEVGGALGQEYYDLPADQPLWYTIKNFEAIAEEDRVFCGERFKSGGYRGRPEPVDFVRSRNWAFKASDTAVTHIGWHTEGHQRRTEARDIIDRLNVAILGYDIVVGYQKALTEGIERLRSKVLVGDVQATRDYLTELTELAALGALEASVAAGELARQEQLAAELAKATLERNWAQASLAASRRVDDGVARLRSALSDYEQSADSGLAKVVTVLTLMQQFLDAAEAVDEIVTAVGAGAAVVEVSNGIDAEVASDGLEVAAPEGEREPAAVGEAGSDTEAGSSVAPIVGPINLRDIDRAFIAANPDFRSGDPKTDLRIVLTRLETVALPTTDPLTTEVTELEKLIAEGLALNLEPGRSSDAPQASPVASFAAYAAANRLGEFAVGSATAWLPGRVALELTKPARIGRGSEWTAHDEYMRNQTTLGEHFERVLNWRVPPEKRQLMLPSPNRGPTMGAAN